MQKKILKFRDCEIEKEIVYKDVINETLNSQIAKQFVYSHRNIFSDYQRRYIVNSIPSIVKEFDYFRDKFFIWYWCFNYNYYVIYKVNRNSKAIEKFIIRDFFKNHYDKHN